MNILTKRYVAVLFIFVCSSANMLINAAENNSEQITVSRESGRELLSTYVTNKRPWLDLPANSEQRQPLYLGATPRELELKLEPIDRIDKIDKTGNKKVRILQSLLDLGVAQIKIVKSALMASGVLNSNDSHQTDLEFEAWPARNDRGQLTWTLARWRLKSAKSWNWLDENELEDFAPLTNLEIAPFLSKIYFPWIKEDHAKIFDDASKMQDLYDKPLFADCVWTPSFKGIVLEAWLPVGAKDNYQAKVKPDTICRYLPQPVRWNGKATSFIVRLTDDKVLWPKTIVPKIESNLLPPVQSSKRIITHWPEDFIDS